MRADFRITNLCSEVAVSVPASPVDVLHVLNDQQDCVFASGIGIRPRTLADFSRTLGGTDAKVTISENRDSPGQRWFLRVELRGFEPLTP